MDNHNIDHDREDRIGFQEVVYGESKSVQDLLNIFLQQNILIYHRPLMLDF